MSIISKTPPSSRAKSPTNFETRHTSFAEAARDTEFRGRDLRLAHEPAFVDRPPHRLGEVVDRVVAETGEKAVYHWLDQAAQAENQQKRAAALEIAENIAKALGLTLEDFLFGRAA